VHRSSTNHLPAHKDALPRGYLSLQNPFSSLGIDTRESEKVRKEGRPKRGIERTCISSGYSGSYRRRFRQRIPLLSSFLRYVDKLYGILGALSYLAFVCRRSVPRACESWRGNKRPFPHPFGALHADTTGNRAFAQVAAKGFFMRKWKQVPLAPRLSRSSVMLLRRNGEPFPLCREKKYKYTATRDEEAG